MTALLEAVVGFSSGILIGAIFIALLIIFNMIPRMMQLFYLPFNGKIIAFALVLGSLFGTFLSFTMVTLKMNYFILIVWGVFHGVFNGMLAAALLEVLRVFPLLAHRVGLKGYTRLFLIALLLGKVCGSILQALLFTE
ncbi:MAG TPA: stage V sporulation protein AB [Pseudogracilibacillus sp.]|nr:stage V sporulation protein AB [Pseudogracilibacillus sp.]